MWMETSSGTGGASVSASAGAPASIRAVAKMNERISVPVSKSLGHSLAVPARERKLPDKLFHLQCFSTSGG